ncbi:LOW QUALITY PROTEIN: G2/mitotic-specific cyclin-B1-like [Cariama cristata]
MPIGTKGFHQSFKYMTYNLEINVGFSCKQQEEEQDALVFDVRGTLPLYLSSYRFPQHTWAAADTAAKSSLPAAKRRMVVASKVGLHPCTALGDFGNRVAEQQPQVAVKKLESPSLTPMETSGCALSEDMLRQAFSHVLLDVKDIDVENGIDPNFCSKYVKNIYSYLRDLEEKQAVRPKYLAGQEITGNMCAILMDWLVQVQIKFILLQETMYMMVAITDCFLQDNAVSKKVLLVGVTAMFIASKYEETYIPETGDFAFVTDHAYTKSQICQMDMKILALDLDLGCPLPLHSLRRASKIAEVDLEQHTLAKYLMELSIVDYEMVHFPPSKTAAAASCLALKVLDAGQWTIKNKYTSSKNAKTSTLAQLNSAVIQNLAKPLAKVL